MNNRSRRWSPIWRLKLVKPDILKTKIDVKVFSSMDCVGILKLRNADVEKRIGPTKAKAKKKNSTKARLVFRCTLRKPDGSFFTLQVASTPILCSKYLSDLWISSIKSFLKSQGFIFWGWCLIFFFFWGGGDGVKMDDCRWGPGCPWVLCHCFVGYLPHEIHQLLINSWVSYGKRDQRRVLSSIPPEVN